MSFFKTTFNSVLLFSLLASPLVADELIYRNDKGELYIGKMEQLYIYISGEKNPSKGINLGLKKPAIKIDNPGKYFLLQNFQTKKEKGQVPGGSYPFIVDHAAPKTSFIFRGATRIKKGKNTIFGKGLIIDMQTKDEGSGVARTEYSLNGEKFTPYTEELALTDEGNYVLAAFGVDNVTNKENVRQKQFTIDLTPPSTHSTFTKEVDKFLSNESTIMLHSKDLQAGVKEIHYKITGKHNVEGGVYEGVPIELKNSRVCGQAESKNTNPGLRHLP